MVISLYYYLRVVKAMFIEKNDTPMPKLMGSLPLKVALVICVMGVVGLGFANGLFEYINTITGK